MKISGYIYQKNVEHVETDDSGVVHFSNYNIYMENAFLNFLKESIDFKTLSSAVKNLRVIDSTLKYKESIMFGDIVNLSLLVQNISICSFQISFQFKKNLLPQEIARGSLRFAYVSDKKITPIPEFLSSLLNARAI